MSDDERTIDKMPEPSVKEAERDTEGAAADSDASKPSPGAAAQAASTATATSAASGPKETAAPKVTAAASPKTTSTTPLKPAAPAPPPYKPEPSSPITMINRPGGLDASAAEPGEKRFAGELDEDFDVVLDRVRMAPDRFSLARRMVRLFEALLPTRIRARHDNRQQIERRIAFDGFRTNLHDEKLERDRRYGTVYTVSEELNAYLVRLEFPRRLPNSSLKKLWNLSDEMPDYNYSISLEGGVLSIRAGVPGEAYRRLSYISASFPSDFLTRIEFRHQVTKFKHRLRNKNLDIVVFKSEDEHFRQAA
jgi:hypothetical protein